MSRRKCPWRKWVKNQNQWPNFLTYIKDCHCDSNFFVYIENFLYIECILFQMEGYFTLLSRTLPGRIMTWMKRRVFAIFCHFKIIKLCKMHFINYFWCVYMTQNCWFVKISLSNIFNTFICKIKSKVYPSKKVLQKLFIFCHCIS